MRWDNLMLSDELMLSDGSAQEPLFGVDDVIRRTFDTPEFRGMTFYDSTCVPVRGSGTSPG